MTKPRGGARASRASPARAAPADGGRGVTDEEVLAVVIELWDSYRAPSTSLIVSQLARCGSVTAALQAGVRDALERLRSRGQLSCVTHRGTPRWTPRSVSPDSGGSA